MRLMINQIVDRRHVGDSLESVIRYTISRLKDKFQGYREMDTEAKAFFIKLIIQRHHDNRNIYSGLMGGNFNK